MYAKRLLALGAETLLLDFPDRDMRAYLERAEFCDLVRADERIRIARRFGLPGKARRESLLPLTRHHIEHVRAEEGEPLAEDLLRLLMRDGPDLTGHTEVFRTCLTELISNVAVHAGTPDLLVAAQRHGNRVLIAFGDEGVGIPNRIRSIKKYGSSDDQRAIDLALQGGISTRVGRGGYGLPTVKDQVAEMAGYIVIRSGTAQVTVDQDRTARSGRCHTLMGTLVEVAVEV